MKASVTDGPERSAIAAAVRTNRPAPMIAPMPSATSDIGPSVRFSVVSPLAAESTSSLSIDLVRNSDPAKWSSQFSEQSAGADRSLQLPSARVMAGLANYTRTVYFTVTSGKDVSPESSFERRPRSSWSKNSRTMALVIV